MDWTLTSRIVLSLGLPFSIFVFVYERRKEREAEAVDVNERLSAAYTDFLKLVIENPDLRLGADRSTPDLDDLQRQRLDAVFEVLTSIFQRAYMLSHGRHMTGKRLKRWCAWEAYMRQWCRRDDYRERLGRLLPVEDSDFAEFIRCIAADEEALFQRDKDEGDRQDPSEP